MISREIKIWEIKKLIKKNFIRVNVNSNKCKINDTTYKYFCGYLK